MDRETIFAELTGVFRDVFGDDTIELAEETTAADIDGWDSLMHITLISEVEGHFDMRFAMKDVIGMKNVGEMVDIIEENI